jgi:hypothetical protein
VCDVTQGGCVALFADDLVAGETYQVEFKPWRGKSKSVDVVAEKRRDLADGTWQVQLWAPVPPKLDFGPAEIKVKNRKTPILEIPAEDFTVIAPPARLAMNTDDFTVRLPDYEMAVGADGAAYVALDISGVARRAEFLATGFGFGLRFQVDDVLLYNTQGMLMEQLSSHVEDEDLNNDGDYYDEGEGDWNGNGRLDNPDVADVVPQSGDDSDAFFYDRHSFEQYEEEHLAGGRRELDSDDPNWHLDGTRHTDHHYLVAVIYGATADGDTLEPGKTNGFELVIDAGEPQEDKGGK